MPSKATSKKNNSANKAKGSSAKKPAAKVTKPAAKPTKPAVKAAKKAATAVKTTVKAVARTAKKVSKAAPTFKKVSTSIANAEMQLLRERYPEAECELDYETDFQLLISVILSAQTTDANVNRVTPNLFRRFPHARALAEADIEDVKEIIKSTGFFNNKAKNIQSCAQELVTRFGGVVPQNIDDLTSLPGVGRKTANVVLGEAHGIPGWTVDTHVQRLSKRLGFTGEEDPEKIEVELQKLFPKSDWSKDSITLIWHGRRCCYARNPDCPSCPVKHLCPSSTAV